MDFEGLYDSNVQKNVLVDGHWKCTINLPQEDPGIYTVSDVPIEIGESQITLHSLYLSPISVTILWTIYSPSPVPVPLLLDPT